MQKYQIIIIIIPEKLLYFVHRFSFSSIKRKSKVSKKHQEVVVFDKSKRALRVHLNAGHTCAGVEQGERQDL